MKRIIIGVLTLSVLALVAATGFAQDVGLAVSANKTVVDGTANPTEYSFTKSFGPLVLFASRTADSISFAVVGKTSGWVAVGLGSPKMNGSTIFMGFVGSDGKVQFKPQLGSGHLHANAPGEVDTTITAYAIKEAGGVTTLEIALKADAYLAKGQPSLDLIFAIGADKSFAGMHTYRGALSLKP
jgi:hypothetical protein